MIFTKENKDRWRELLTPYIKERGEKIFIITSALILLLFAIALRIVIYAKSRSLWLDEAMLAESIVARNWTDLLASPLSNNQTAPVLYIISVKAICSVFGYSESSLRIFSLFSFWGLLVCEWFFLKNILKIDNIKTAFVLVLTAVVPSFIYYSNELKPYMSDVFFVILALLLYAFHTQKKISLTRLTIFYILILGFCTPAIFFIGGILTTEFFVAVYAKNRKYALCVLISGLSIIALFGLYYLWWMLPSANFMDNYWNIRNKIRLKAAIIDVFSIWFRFNYFDYKLIWALVPFALLGIYSLIKQKNNIAYSVVLSVFFVCLASSIGKWPLIGRLWLFLTAIIFVFSSVGFDLISKKKNIVFKVAVFCLFLAIALYYTLCCFRLFKKGIYSSYSEINPLIQYTKEHIMNDEKLYVYPLAIYTLKFKNGYTTMKIGQTDSDNIIYGINRFAWNENKLGTELDTIIKSRNVYLLFQQQNSTRIDSGLAVLQEYGTVTKILDYHRTPLYYFEAHD